MWKIKAGTTIQVFMPFGKVGKDWKDCQHYNPQTQTHYHDTAPWKGYVTKEDKIYDKCNVWDAVAVMNNRDDVPEWAKRTVMEKHKYVIWETNSKGQIVYAHVNPRDIEYLD